MSPFPDDLTGMKEDMTAFIEGLGMRRFFGYVECEEVPSVLWDSGQNPDGWKDFVELAKVVGRALSDDALLDARPRRIRPADRAAG